MKQRKESIDVLAVFLLRTTGKECAAYVMEKYRMTIDGEESSSIRRVSCAQSNKRQKDGEKTKERIREGKRKRTGA